jgi:uncharacterized protein (TIGR02117 family)
MFMRKIFHLLVILLIGLMAGCADPHRGDLYPPAADSLDNQRIHFVAYESHTGIIIDRQFAAPWLPVMVDEFRGSRYLEFGWGDLDWYLADSDQRTSGIALSALFVPTESGLWVWSVPTAPETFFGEKYITELTLSRQGFIGLISFINGSFELDQAGRPQSVREAVFKEGVYRIYRARGDYHAFKTCNHWTAEALKAAGFSTGLFDRYNSESFLKRVKVQEQQYQQAGGKPGH